ncbi:MAG: alpha/beta fold hydrolase [Actinomycetota bacterium]|nr:alpha/beta fold hydrolase [Actinomycetota bacterium]
MADDFERRFIDTGEVKLNIVDEGVGFPVLLLHGFPDTSRMWRNQIPALTEAGYRVIAPDLRGFGESDRPSGIRAYEMSKILADLTGLLDRLGIGEANVVGHDWGAITAWGFAGHHPYRTKRLVAVSVGHPAGFTRPSLSQMRKSWYVFCFQIPWVAEIAFSAGHWALLRAAFGGSPDFDRYVEDLSKPGALTAGLNWYRANTRPDRILQNRRLYPRVKTDTLGIWGSKDWALTEGQMTASKKFVDGNWRYERLEAGHWIPLRRAEILNQLLLDFFD